MPDGGSLPALLDQLAGRLRDQGASVVDTLRPGLSDQEMDDLVGPLGMQLPAEARQWWMWHDGSSSTMTGHALVPGRIVLPLAVAVDEARTCRLREPEPPVNALEASWPIDWLPILLTGHAAIIAIQCRSNEVAAPVVYRDLQADLPEPQVGSLADLVRMWLDMFDIGAYEFDREQQNWKKRFERIPQELAGSGLV